MLYLTYLGLQKTWREALPWTPKGGLAGGIPDIQPVSPWLIHI